MNLINFIYIRLRWKVNSRLPTVTVYTINSSSFEMEILLVFVTLVAAVSVKNLPSTDYVPTKEQLAMIFGAYIPPETSAVETPALVLNESVNIGKKNIKPYQKKNQINNNVTRKTVELNIKIKVNDCDKIGADKTAKQNPEKGSPDIHTRFVEDLSLTDDRVALRVDECPSDKVRFNEKCVTPDT